MSSGNPVIHGLYSLRSVPIRVGVFAEDPLQHESYVQALVESLRPRTVLQGELAYQIAIQFVRLRRHERFEAVAIGGATLVEEPGALAGVDLVDATLTILQAFSQMRFVLSGERKEPDEVSFGALLQILRLSHPRTGFVAGLQDLEAIPEDEAKRTFFTLVDELFPNRSEALSWIDDQLRERQARVKAGVNASRPEKAMRGSPLYEGLMNGLTVSHARIMRDLQRLFQMYAAAQLGGG